MVAAVKFVLALLESVLAPTARTKPTRVNPLAHAERYAHVLPESAHAKTAQTKPRPNPPARKFDNNYMLNRRLMADVEKSAAVHQASVPARTAQTRLPTRARPPARAVKSAPALQESALVRIAPTKSRHARESPSDFFEDDTDDSVVERSARVLLVNVPARTVPIRSRTFLSQRRRVSPVS